MKTKILSVLKYAVSLGLAIALMYWVFKGIDWNVFKEKAKEVNYWWVAFSIALSLVAYYSRAYRWNILLAPLGYKSLSVHRTTLAVLLGYLANLVFPRLGEVTRCGMLKRTDDVDVSNSFGTVITERLMDFVMLVALLFLALLLEYDQLVLFLEKNVSLEAFENLNITKWVLILLGLGLLGALTIFILFKSSAKVRGFLLNIWQGIISLRNIENVSGFFISTFVLWLVYYAMSYTIVYALPETSHLGWEVGIMLLVTGGIALSIPVQGGFGTYHTLISAMLALYFVERNTGIFLATLLHTSQVVATALFGGIAMLISIFVKKQNASK